MLLFVYRNLQFRLPILPSLLYCESEAVVRCCSAKKVLLQIPQNLQKNTKKEIPAQMFSCEFCEIFHNVFFKEPFERLLHHKHSFCLLSCHDLSTFQKQCHTYYLPEYIFGLICRLGTRMNSIFQALSQKSILNPVKHLRWRFFAKIVNSLKKPLNIFSKKAPL